MKLSIDLKGSLSIISKLKSNYTLLLWLFLAIIAVLTGLVVFSEARKVTQVQTDSAAIWDRIVRVNLNDHRSIEKRLGENSSFQAISVPGSDAFGPPPADVKLE